MIYRKILYIFSVFILIHTPYVQAQSLDQYPNHDQKTIIKQTQQPKIAVVFPKVPRPYNQIFLSVITGLKKVQDVDIISYEIRKDHNPEELYQSLVIDDITDIVGLGNRGISTVYKMKDKKRFRIVFGLSELQPTKISKYHAISTLPSATNLFAQIHVYSKFIKRVHVVYEKGKQDQLIDLATEQAKLVGLELDAHGVNGAINTALAYKALLNNINPKSEALWLINGSDEIDKSIFNEVLTQAWNKKIIVFSNYLADVKLGILFSLYPDNEKTGEQLMRFLLKLRESTDEPAQIYLSQDLLIAINLRTASHLGIFLTDQQKQAYSFIYPAE